MRQPLCGLLLCVVGATVAAPVEACSADATTPPVKGAPCSGDKLPRASEDFTCCHGPDFKPVASDGETATRVAADATAPAKIGPNGEARK